MKHVANTDFRLQSTQFDSKEVEKKNGTWNSHLTTFTRYEYIWIYSKSIYCICLYKAELKVASTLILLKHSQIRTWRWKGEVKNQDFQSQRNYIVLYFCWFLLDSKITMKWNRHEHSTFFYLLLSMWLNTIVWCQ